MVCPVQSGLPVLDVDYEESVMARYRAAPIIISLLGPGIRFESPIDNEMYHIYTALYGVIQDLVMLILAFGYLDNRT